MNAATPRFCWVDAEGPRRNHFAFFRREITLPAAVSSAVLHLFADTRYRLLVNGRSLAFGPARFFPGRTEFDTCELRKELRPGRNRMEVEVWSAGAANFQSVSAPPVFWADGEIVCEDGTRESLATPGAWRARVATSREADAIPLSFAIGSVEILNVSERNAEIASDDFHEVVRVSSAHSLPAPRSIPEMSEFTRLPATSLFAGEGSAGPWRRCGAFGVLSRFEAVYVQPRRQRMAYSTWIFSAVNRRRTLRLAWGNHWLNGQALTLTAVEGLGNCHSTEVELNAGWNGLAGSCVAGLETWGMMIGLPTDLCLAARPETHAPSGSWIGWAEDDDHTRNLSAGIGHLPGEWAFAASDSHSLAPARDVAWDRPAVSCTAAAFPHAPVTLRTGAEGLAILTLAFDTEFFGRPVWAIDCPTPCVVDVSCDEYLRADGTVDMFGCLQLIHSTDRFRCNAGHTAIEAFHNRGGRYLQFNIRTTPHTEVVVSEVGVREFKTPVDVSGTFSTNDDFWNWAWETSLRTLHASLEDVWSDSPWREQGCYLGDSLVQFHAHACLATDMRLPRRILRLFAAGQRPDGQLACVVPAHMTRAHPDFTLLFVKFLRDYWALTGDSDLVHELWPIVQRILDSPTWLQGNHGLVRTDAGPLFIDWSVEPEARSGFSSVLNMLFAGALRFAAELAPVAGADPAVWTQRATTAEHSIHTALWNDALGRFRCTILEDGTVIDGRALHANSLAGNLGIATPTQQDRLVPWMIAELDDNAGKIIRCRQSHPQHPYKRSGQLDVYFLFFLLDWLGTRGESLACERIITATWNVMREAGSPTFWESIAQSAFRDGSQCHSWSVAPLLHASRRILGATRPQPGNPNLVRIQPQPGSLTQAKGRIPHPDGPIDIQWQIQNGTLTLHVNHPPTVTVDVQPPNESLPIETVLAPRQ